MPSLVKSEPESGPGVVTQNEDGSFAIDGKLYLPEVRCYIESVNHNLMIFLKPLMERADFDINKFELKVNANVITGVNIKMKDSLWSGSDGMTRRSVDRSSLISRRDGVYIKVKVQNIVYAIKKITCVCLSSHSEEGSFRKADQFGTPGTIADKVMINTTLDQFFCVGDAAKTVTREDIISAVKMMNRVGYGMGETEGSHWFYDIDYNLVRSFSQKASTVVGSMTPAEAIQIAAQLNSKGDWAGVQEFDRGNQLTNSNTNNSTKLSGIEHDKKKV
jgi:hypothetical protein